MVKAVADDVDVEALPKFARRLRELVGHLKVSQRKFALKLDLDPSTINRVWHGERSQEDNSAKIVLGAQRVFRVRPQFWEEEGPVEAFLGATHAENVPTMNVTRLPFLRDQDDPKYALVQASAEVGDPPAVQNELLLAKPPTGGESLGWWVQEYVRVRARHVK